MTASKVCAGLVVAVFLCFAFFSVFAAGGPAYDFELKSLDSTNVSLSSYKGKNNVILLFWTTWCPYCRTQLSVMNKRLPELQKDNIVLLAIDAGERKSKVEDFVKSKNLSLKVLLDEDGRIAGKYQVYGVPTYVLVDKEGNIVSVDNSFPEDKLKGLRD